MLTESIRFCVISIGKSCLNIHILFVLTALLLTGQSIAAVLETQLPNGLTLIVREDHRAPVIVTQLWYRVGSSYEQTGRTGLSHALEHMMFQGTENVPRGVYSRTIAELGGDDNAFTARHYTAYYSRLGKEHLKQILEFEADRMTGLVIDDENFLREMEVIREERRSRIDGSVHGRFFEQFQRHVYSDPRMQNPPIGWEADLNQLTSDDARNWYRRWYHPENSILVINGDVDLIDTLGLVEDYFASIPSAEPMEQLPVGPALVPLAEFEWAGKTELPYLILAYRTPVIAGLENPQDAVALDLLSVILGGGNSSRLTNKLVRGQEIALSASAGYDPFERLQGLFVVAANPPDKIQMSGLEAALISEVDILKIEPVAASELQRVKTRIIANYVYSQDSMFGVASQMGQLESIGIDWRMAERYTEMVKKITPDDLKRVANQYLIEKNLTIGRLLPETEE
ncbi:MAG: zinc protease [Gammaproteobacteria bacterium]|jgi:zinc protease